MNNTTENKITREDGKSLRKQNLEGSFGRKRDSYCIVHTVRGNWSEFTKRFIKEWLFQRRNNIFFIKPLLITMVAPFYQVFLEGINKFLQFNNPFLISLQAMREAFFFTVLLPHEGPSYAYQYKTM